MDISLIIALIGLKTSLCIAEIYIDRRMSQNFELGLRGDVKIRRSLPLPAATDCQWCHRLLQTVQIINYHIITSHTILSCIDMPYVTHLVSVKYYVQ